MENLITNVLSKYFNTEIILQIETIQNGLINKTYKVKTRNGDYVLQNINKNVFPNIFSLLNNKIKITEYLTKQGFNTIEFIPNTEKQFYTIHNDEVWQLSNYIPSVVYNRVQSVMMSKKAGQYLADFHYSLLHFPISELEYTIPDFHNTIKRFSDFNLSISQAYGTRVSQAAADIKILLDHYKQIEPIAQKINNGEIPLRVVHNDTKIANMLFNENEEIICLIDLDTLMPGSILHDVGDALRTATNTSTEEEKDLSKVKFDKEIYNAFMLAYREGASHFISPEESGALKMALPIMLFEQACRFLTDFFNYDQYYSTSYPEQNLARARTQIKLLNEVSEYLNTLDSV